MVTESGTTERIIFEIILNPCLSPKIKVLVVVPVFRARFCTSNGQLWHKVALFTVFYNTPIVEPIYSGKPVLSGHSP